MKGSFTGDHFDRINVDGLIDPEQGFWIAQGSAEGVQISPTLRASLPRELAGQLAPLAALRGRLRLDYKLVHRSNSNEPTQFVVDGELTEGQIEDPRLPYPLTDIKAHVRCDNRGLAIDHMTAKSGLGVYQTHLPARRLRRRTARWCSLPKFGSSSSIPAWPRVLPPQLRGEWNKLSPTGLVHLDLSLTFDGQRWQPNLKIDCVDVSFAYYKFPYRMQGGIGVIHLKENTLTVRLRALAAGQVVRFDGDFLNPGADYTGALTVAVDGPIPLGRYARSARSIPMLGKWFAPCGRAAALPPAPASSGARAGVGHRCTSMPRSCCTTAPCSTSTFRIRWSTFAARWS